MKLGVTGRELTSVHEASAMKDEKIDELSARLQVGITDNQVKRDIETMLKLQEREERQRRANDHLETENGRLRALLAKAGVDYTPMEPLEDKPLSPVVTGFLQ